MNTRVKAQLNTIIATLTDLHKGELAATKRHDKAGEDAYRDHAAWCSRGILEAITLLENKFPADAIGILRMIVASSPTDNLVPFKSTPVAETLPSICGAGNCNHPEHI